MFEFAGFLFIESVYVDPGQTSMCIINVCVCVCVVYYTHINTLKPCEDGNVHIINVCVCV